MKSSRMLAVAWGMAGVLLAGLPGCSAYQLRGTVVQGQTPAVLLVGADDPRLAEPGLADVMLEFMLDPQRPGEQRLGPALSDSLGRFGVEVSATGAGLLEYELLVRAHRPGFSAVEEQMALPSSGRRLLIVMVPGQDRPSTERDILRDTLREGQRLSNP